MFLIMIMIFSYFIIIPYSSSLVNFIESSSKIFNRFDPRNFLHIGHKNQAHIQLILLYHIRSYTELYFYAHHELELFSHRYKVQIFCESFHQVISLSTHNDKDIG